MAREISVKGHGVPYPVTTFLEANFPGMQCSMQCSLLQNNMSIADYITNILLKQGFVEPTAIQAQVM